MQIKVSRSAPEKKAPVSQDVEPAMLKNQNGSHWYQMTPYTVARYRWAAAQIGVTNCAGFTGRLAAHRPNPSTPNRYPIVAMGPQWAKMYRARGFSSDSRMSFVYLAVK